LDEDGKIDRAALDAIQSDDANLSDLKELVHSKNVILVRLSAGGRVVDDDGNVQEAPFFFSSREEELKLLEESGVLEIMPEEEREAIGPSSFLGVFTRPEESDQVGIGRQATVTLADESVQAPELETAITTAHELYGHALLFDRGEPYGHGTVQDEFFVEIEERTKANVVKERRE
jgi:hypothetical protein